MSEWDQAAVQDAVTEELAVVVPDVALKATDNFFSSGGDSFGVAQFISGLRKRGLSLTARDFMDDPTPEGLVRSVLRRLESASS